MAKLLSKKLMSTTDGLVFWCPGCYMHHPVAVGAPNRNGAIWDWNEDAEKPTFHPSVLVRLGEQKVCHLFVEDGKLKYLSDSYHQFAGQTLELPDIPEDELDYE